MFSYSIEMNQWIKTVFRNSFLVSIMYSQVCLAEPDLDIERSPLSIGTSIEMGQIIEGSDPFEQLQLRGDFVPRTGVWLTQAATINQRLDLKMGVGGLFWYSWPEKENQTHMRGTKFGPGISLAQALYKFGDLENPIEIQIGFFPYKYNPDAYNLGEYLFRCGTYPGFLFTGGWNIINSAAYMGQGIRVGISNFNGMLQHDFTLFMERDYVPQFDFTPSYVARLDLGFLELGAGISFNHFLPVKPSRLEPKHELNAYVRLDSFPEIPVDTLRLNGDTIQYYHSAGPQEGLEKEFGNLKDANGIIPFKERIWYDALRPDTSVLELEVTTTAMQDEKLWQDTTTGAYLAEASVPDTADPRWIKTDIDRYQPGGEYRYPRTTSYYSFKGIKLMGRISLRLQDILQLEFLGPKDLRIFAEAAVLGTKNYDFYYEDISRRIPVMFGITLPTFKLLDILAFQAEYYNSPFPNNIKNLWYNGVPIWTLPYPEYPERYDEEDYKGDNWKWSVYGSRSITAGINLFFQVASDHLRMLHYEARPSYWAVLQNPTDWYYMFRLELGI
jgi:hypothetical protein